MTYPPLAIRAQLRWAVVQPLVRQIAPATTIEVGVGQGAMGARIADMTSQRYVAFELDHDAYQRAQPRVAEFGGEVYNRALAEVGPEPADLLCAFEVLEHMADDRAALAEWCRYIRPGGWLLLSVPAHPERFGPMDAHAGHYRRYTTEGISDLVRSLDMVDVRVQLYGAPLGYLLEAVRNVIDARKLRHVAGASPETLSSASGRTFQFDHRSWKSVLATAAVRPFIYLQRAFPGGVGLVLAARKPVEPA